jgi:hypothetical protein
MATCAICLQPIPNGVKFVLSTTEVLHRTCALAGGETVLAKNRRALAEQAVLLERALRAGERSVQNVAEVQRRLDVCQRAAAVSGQQHDEVARERDRLLRERDEAFQQRDRARDRLLRERDEAFQQRDRARAELGDARAAVTAPARVVDEPSDDAVVRFSLLELDSV